MALYGITRTTQPEPGGFVSAFVLAAGSSVARKSISESCDVPYDELIADSIGTAMKGTDTVLLGARFDESPTLYDALATPYIPDPDAEDGWSSSRPVMEW